MAPRSDLRPGSARDPDTTAEEQAVNLTIRPGGDFNPVFSPDGRRIAYSRQDDLWTVGDLTQGVIGNAGTDLYVMDSDGTDPRRVTEPGAISGSPAWSVDGTALYYSRVGAEGAQIRRVSLDGSSDQVIAPLGLSPAVDAGGRIGFSQPQPRPGMQIMDMFRTGAILSVASDGSGLRPETDGAGQYFAPDFDRSSGRTVAHGTGTAEDVEAAWEATFAPPGAQEQVDLPDRTIEVRGIRGYFPATLGPHPPNPTFNVAAGMGSMSNPHPRILQNGNLFP